MTIEEKEKAKAYADRYEAKPMAETAIRAYIAGHFEALASQWKDPKVELPEDGEYVLISTDRGIEPSVWNEHHQCWDDAEGDDYMYSKEYVEAWMSIPPLKGGAKCQ